MRIKQKHEVDSWKLGRDLDLRVGDVLEVRPGSNYCDLLAPIIRIVSIYPGLPPEFGLSRDSIIGNHITSWGLGDSPSFRRVRKKIYLK